MFVLLMMLAAAAAASSEPRKKFANLRYFLLQSGPRPRMPGAAQTQPGPPVPAHHVVGPSPPVILDQVIVADFAPVHGSYPTTTIPKTCIWQFCVDEREITLGFPDGWIPADDLLVELWSGTGPIVVEAQITTGAHFSQPFTGTPAQQKANKTKERHEAKATGAAHLFRACRGLTYEGVGGLVDGDLDISIVHAWTAGQPIPGGGKPLQWSAECDFAVGSNIPRLTVVRRGGSTRLYLWQASRRSLVRFDIRLTVWRV